MSPSETTAWPHVEKPTPTTQFAPLACPPAMAPSAIVPFAYVAQPSQPSFYDVDASVEAKKAHAKMLIGNALQQRINSIDEDNCEPGGEDAFFVGDLGEIYRQHMRWKKNLPRIEAFYGKLTQSDT